MVAAADLGAAMPRGDLKTVNDNDFMFLVCSVVLEDDAVGQGRFEDGPVEQEHFEHDAVEQEHLENDDVAVMDLRAGSLLLFYPGPKSHHNTQEGQKF